MAQQATSAAVGHDAGAKASFPPFESGTFPSQLLWLALCFGTLYYFMSKRFLPQVGAIIESRKARIAKDIDDATKLQQQADAAAAAHEKSLADARAQAQLLAQNARNDAARQADAQKRQVEADFVAKLADADGRIGAMRLAAMANVEQIAHDATSAIVERLLGKSVDSSAVAAALAAAKTN